MSLEYLPPVRRRIGQYNHLRIYKKILLLKSNFEKLNFFLGNLFPEELHDSKIHVYFEVRLGCRIPDCIIVFRHFGEKLLKTFHCYFFEFKTTFAKSNLFSIQKNRTQKIQYLQGLRQLRQATDYLQQFVIKNESLCKVNPVICFFRQHGLKLDFVKTFIAKELQLSSTFLCNLFTKYQNDTVKSILSISNPTNFRRACQKYSNLYRGRYATTPKLGNSKTSKRKRRKHPRS